MTLCGCGGSGSPTGRSIDTAAAGGIPGAPDKPPPEEPEPPAEGEAIVFAGSRAVMMIKPDGTGEFTVAKSGTYPSWSPDGSQIVFVGYVGNGNKRRTELFIINADASGLRQLTDSPEFVENDPDWSPVADQIVFYGYPAGTSVDLGARDIWVINADGSGLQNLTNSPGISDSLPTWSPDGTQIACNRYDQDADDSNIWIMNADGGEPVRLTNDQLGVSFFPAWSPDGTKIAFESSRDGNFEIYVLNVADAAAGDWGQELNLTNDPATDRQPAWSPDGSKIVLSSKRGGAYWGYVMNADGTDVQLIYDGDFYRPDWRAAP